MQKGVQVIFATIQFNQNLIHFFIPYFTILANCIFHNFSQLHFHASSSCQLPIWLTGWWMNWDQLKICIAHIAEGSRQLFASGVHFYASYSKICSKITLKKMVEMLQYSRRFFVYWSWVMDLQAREEATKARRRKSGGRMIALLQ